MYPNIRLGCVPARAILRSNEKDCGGNTIYHQRRRNSSVVCYKFARDDWPRRDELQRRFKRVFEPFSWKSGAWPLRDSNRHGDATPLGTCSFVSFVCGERRLGSNVCGGGTMSGRDTESSRRWAYIIIELELGADAGFAIAVDVHSYWHDLFNEWHQHWPIQHLVCAW